MGKENKKVLYEQAKQDYINACEAKERLEVDIDKGRDELRFMVMLHGTLVTACDMFARRMKELKS